MTFLPLDINPATGLRFPLQVNDWKRKEVRTFSQKEWGVQIGYALDGFAKADLYIYNGGSVTIPTGIDSDIVRKEFYGVQGAILDQGKTGKYMYTEKVLDSAPEIKTDKGIAKVLVAMYRLAVPDKQTAPFSSWILLTGYINHFIKIRYSHDADQFEKGQEALKVLITELLKANEGETKYFFTQAKDSAPVVKTPAIF
jgi:hypothetical protein